MFFAWHLAMHRRELRGARSQATKHLITGMCLICASLLGLLGIYVFLSVAMAGERGEFNKGLPSPILPSLRKGFFAGSSPSFTLTPTAYLPLVARSDGPIQDHPIWAHSFVPTSHEVVLFRRTFTLDKQLDSAELIIFADTRYEAWLDGSWVGRGPARFSKMTREYDVYQLGDLQSGSHLVAVLVQWAPNNRRSESTEPFLQAHIQGITSSGSAIPVRSDSQWKTWQSNAWRADAALVHAWKLIGPTELVDLRWLPNNWMLAGFSDDEWSAAMERNLNNLANQPRSIALLDRVPVTLTVIDAGLLSPGRTIGELVPPVADPYLLSFDVLNSTTFTIEMLSESVASLADAVRLNGRQLAWQEGGTHRPDVYIASTSVFPGTHTLSFTGVPFQGLTFSISTQEIQPQTLPFQQGVHAGRRVLLAEATSQPSQVMISDGETGVSVEFPGTPAYIVLDLGRVVHGRLVAEVTGLAGDVVDIGWDERLWMDTRPLPYPGSLHSQWNQTDSWVLDGTTRSISTLDARAGRYILVAAWGKGSIQLENIQVYEERYPVIQRGEFSSSSARLDEIWQVGVDTLYCNMVDAYTDTPWRERGQWWGDAFVEDQINRVAFGDTGLLRRGLLFMAEAFKEGRPDAMAPNGGSNHMLDYGMLWAQSLNDYWRLTGDATVLVKVYPALQAFLDYLAGYENSVTGLLDIPFDHWSQTVFIDWAGYSSRYGQSTALNALYYGTLMDAAVIADRVGDDSNAHAWRQKASLIKQQINANLYLSHDRRYISGLFEGQSLLPSPQAQAWALAYGLVPENQVSYVATSLLELLSSDPSSPNVEIYGMFWVLKALGDAGLISQALHIIENYYGRMLDLGATTWWEGFNSHLFYTVSLSHGWGGAPTWFLTSYVLGARRLGPDTWLVKPPFRGVDYASGSLPLQDGELQIHWTRHSCEHSQLELDSPAGTRGELVVPFVSESTVLTLNGQVIWQDGSALIEGVVMDSDGIRVSLGEGTYHLEARQDCYNIYLPTVTR